MSEQQINDADIVTHEGRFYINCGSFYPSPIGPAAYYMMGVPLVRVQGERFPFARIGDAIKVCRREAAGASWSPAPPAWTELMREMADYLEAVKAAGDIDIKKPDSLRAAIIKYWDEEFSGDFEESPKMKKSRAQLKERGAL